MNLKTSKLLKTLLSLGAFLTCTQVYAAQAVVVGYLEDANWSGTSASIPWAKISHIYDAFGTISGTTASLPANAAAMLSTAKANGVRCYISFGGAGEDGDWPTSAANAKTLADSMASVCSAGKFDGIDIDWEWTTAANQQAVLDALITELHSKLTWTPTTAPNRGESSVGLTMYLMPGSDTCSYDFTTTNQYIDWYDDPGYDMNINPALTTDSFQGALYEPTSTFTNNNGCTPGMGLLASIYSVSYWYNTNQNTAGTAAIGNVPYTKMVLGMPFYARNDAGANAVFDTSIFAGYAAGTYDTTRCECPYTSGGVTYGVDTNQSFCDKMNWAFGKGYRGIAIWELSEGLPTTSSTMMTNIWTVIGDAVSGTTGSCLTTTSCGTGCAAPTPTPPCGVLVQNFEIGTSYSYFGYPDTLSVNTGCTGQAMAANYLSPGLTGSYAVSLSGAQLSTCVWGPDFLVPFASSSATSGPNESSTNAVSFTMDVETGNTSGPSTIIFGVEAFPNSTDLYSTDIVVPAASVGQTISYTLYYSSLLYAGASGLNSSSLYQMLWEPRWTGNYGIKIDDIWLVCAPTPTPSPTPTNSPTVTKTPTSTYTPTVAATNTYTPTVTKTNTPLPTNTGTYTPTATPTKTNSPTVTATNTTANTNTFTPTKTNTNTATPTASNTNSPTVTKTNTPANTATFTSTVTSTPTKTNSPSATNTNTPANTSTFTPTKTSTNTFTPTNTITNTNTVTSTTTPTRTNTGTPTNTPLFSYTFTNSPTNTLSPTVTHTPTSTPTKTATSSPTNTFTLTPTPTFTNTLTYTATKTNTNSPTSTSTSTNTLSPTITSTPTVTGTPTNTPLFSFTFTSTPTVTNSPTKTFTSTVTNTFTWTSTLTPTVTNTPTITGTPTDTPLFSFTFTSTPTVTNSPTKTFTDTSTSTLTPTATSTNTSLFTATSTSTHTATWTATNSFTPIFTPTATVTPTFTFTLTPTATSTATQPVVNVTFSHQPGNTTVNGGATNVVVLGLSATNASGESVNLTSISLSAGGSGVNSSGIISLTVWKDPSGDGLISSSTVVTTVNVPYSGGNNIVVNLSDVIGANSTEYYLVSYNFSNAPPAGTYTVGLTGMNGSGAISLKPILVNGLPLNSTTFTVNANTSTPTVTATVTTTATKTASLTPTKVPTAMPTGSPTPVIYPNPGDGGPISIAIPGQRGTVSVKVELFTTAFRKVQTTTFPSVPAGTPAGPLQMTDEWGNRLASGLYYVVLTTTPNSNSGDIPLHMVGKMLLLR